jgi:hypothetical protein
LSLRSEWNRASDVLDFRHKGGGPRAAPLSCSRYAMVGIAFHMLDQLDVLQRQPTGWPDVTRNLKIVPGGQRVGGRSRRCGRLRARRELAVPHRSAVRQA